MPPETRGRLEALVESMRVRLRPLCADWPQDAFDEMVLRLAEITLKYEGKATSGIYDRRSTDSLREETRTLLDAADESRKAGESNKPH